MGGTGGEAGAGEGGHHHLHTPLWAYARHPSTHTQTRTPPCCGSSLRLPLRRRPRAPTPIIAWVPSRLWSPADAPARRPRLSIGMCVLCVYIRHERRSGRSTANQTQRRPPPTTNITGIEPRVQAPQDHQLQGAPEVVEVRHAQHPGRRGPAPFPRRVLAVALWMIMGVRSVDSWLLA